MNKLARWEGHMVYICNSKTGAVIRPISIRTSTHLYGSSKSHVTHASLQGNELHVHSSNGKVGVYNADTGSFKRAF